MSSNHPASETQNPPAPAPAGPPAPVVAPPAEPPAAANLAEEVARLKRHNEQILREKKTAVDKVKSLEDRHTKLATEFGFTPETDPATIAAKREADTRAAKDRESRIEREVLKGLLGRPGVTSKDAEFIAWEAGRSPTVTIDDTGNLLGLSEFIAEELKHPRFAPAEPSTPRPNSPPPRPAPAAPAPGGPLDPRLANVKGARDFIRLPALDQVDLEAKYPDLVRELLRKTT